MVEELGKLIVSGLREALSKSLYMSSRFSAISSPALLEALPLTLVQIAG